jgi:hypothetical protein
VLIAGGRSQADESPSVPRGISLDRTGTRSSGGIELSGSVDGAEESLDTSAARLDLFAQVIAGGGLGGYGVVPLLWTDARVAGEGAFSIGNAELGGLYVVPGPALSFVLRAGSTLPLVTDDDSVQLATANRLTDLVHVRAPHAVARLSISSIARAGIWTGRADLGIDITYARLAESEERNTVVRAAAGSGLALGAVDAWLEVVHVQDDERGFVEGGGSAAGWQHAFSFSLRLRAFLVQPVVGFTVAILDYGPVIDFVLDQPSPVYVLTLGGEIVPPPGWIRRTAPGRR